MPSSPSRSSGSPEASPPHHIYRDGVTKAVLRPPHSSASGSVQSTSSYSAPPLPLLPPLSIASSSGSRSDAGGKYVDAATGAPLARKPPTPLRLSNEQQHFSRVRSPLSPTSPLSPSSTSSFALSQTVRDPATGAPIRQHLHLYPQQPYSDQLPLSPPPAHKTTRYETPSPAGTVGSIDSDELAFAAAASVATPRVPKAPSTASSTPSAAPSASSSSFAEQDQHHRATERNLPQHEHNVMPHVMPPMASNEPFTEHHHHPYDQQRQHHEHQQHLQGHNPHDQRYHHHSSAAARTPTISHKRQHSSSLSPSSPSPTAQPGRTTPSRSSSSSRHASSSPTSHAHSSSSAGPEKKRVRFVDDDA